MKKFADPCCSRSFSTDAGIERLAWPVGSHLDAEGGQTGFPRSEVSGSWGRSDEAPQAGWLQTTDVYFSARAGAGGLKSGHGQGHTLPTALEEDPSLPLPGSWRLLAILSTPWLVDAPLQLRPLSLLCSPCVGCPILSSVCLCAHFPLFL